MCHHHKCSRRWTGVFSIPISIGSARFPHKFLENERAAAASDAAWLVRGVELIWQIHTAEGETAQLYAKQKGRRRRRGSSEAVSSTIWGCGKCFVTCFLRVPQAARLNCSCHAAQASRGNFQKTCFKTFYWTCRPRLLSVAHPLVHDNLLNVFLEIPQAGGSMV